MEYPILFLSPLYNSEQQNDNINGACILFCIGREENGDFVNHKFGEVIQMEATLVVVGRVAIRVIRVLFFWTPAESDVRRSLQFW